MLMVSDSKVSKLQRIDKGIPLRGRITIHDRTIGINWQGANFSHLIWIEANHEGRGMQMRHNESVVPFGS